MTNILGVDFILMVFTTFILFPMIFLLRFSSGIVYLILNFISVYLKLPFTVVNISFNEYYYFLNMDLLNTQGFPIHILGYGLFVCKDSNTLGKYF